MTDEDIKAHRKLRMIFAEVPACESCGCLGSESCGHKHIGEDCGMWHDMMICKCCAKIIELDREATK